MSIFRKAAGALYPAEPESEGIVSTLKEGALVNAKIVRSRNLQFHRKFFALLNHGFEAWNPEPITYRGQVARRNFDEFRRDVTIIAGYYTVEHGLDGKPKIRPKSISFGSMGDDEFEKLYSACLNVILESVLTNYTREDLDQVVDQILAFG